MQETLRKRIGFAVTGSFCTFSAAFAQAERLVAAGYTVTPIFQNMRLPWTLALGKPPSNEKNWRKFVEARHFWAFPQ